MRGGSTADHEVATLLFDVYYVLELQPLTRLEHVSASVLDFLGYTADEVSGDPGLLLRVVDPRDRDVMLAVFNAEVGLTTHLTVRWVAKDGRVVWSRQTSRKVQRDDGSVVLHAALAHVDEESLASERHGLDGRYRMLAHDSSIVVFQTDRDGRIRSITESIETVAGWPPSEVIGTNALDLLAPQDRRTGGAIEESILAGQSRSGVVVRIRTADSGTRFISATARPARDEITGEVTGTVVSWRDVDSATRARLEAEAERQILRAALDAHLDPHGVLEAVRDDAGRIVDLRCIELNSAGCRALGLARDQALGASLLELIPDLAGSALMTSFIGVVDSRDPLVLNDAPSPRIDSGERYDLLAVPVNDGLSITWRDVTTRYESASRLAASEAHYRLLLEHSSDLVTFHSRDGVVQWVSPSIRRLLGREPDEVEGRLLDLIHRDDLQGVLDLHAAILAGEQDGSVRFRLRSKDGRWSWFEGTARAVRDDAGELDSLVVFSHDISAQVDYEKALADSERRYRLLAEHATDVVYRSGLDGTTEWVSEGLTRILGFAPEEFIGRDGMEHVHPEDRAFVSQAMAEVLAGERDTARFRMQTKAGGVCWIEATIHPLHDEQGSLSGFVGGWRDVQAEVEAGEALERRARTDNLTGLLNRGEAVARLATWLSPGGQLPDGLAVAFCDVDHFKGVNDRLGHAAGDRLLQVVADRVVACVRGSDMVARFGGDEILLLMRGVGTMETAVTVAEKVRHAVRTPLELDGEVVQVTVSIGVTMAEGHDDVDSLIARADRAMFAAKSAGRDQVIRLG